MRRFASDCLVGCAVLLCAEVLLTSCSKKREDLPDLSAVEGAREEQSLARVGDQVITEEDFQYEVERRKASGRLPDTPEEILNDLIERQAMLQQANASGLLNDPDVERAVENQMLSQWLDRTVYEKKQQVQVSDEELRQAYEADKDRFRRPAMARLAILMRTLSPTASAEQTEAVRQELLDAAAHFRENRDEVTRNGRISGFGAVAADVSEHTVSRYRGGDLGWIRADAAMQRWPEELVEAGFGLKTGDISDVLEIDNTLYVVMKSDGREATVTPFEEAKISMRRRMIREKQEQIETEFQSNVLASVRISINNDKAADLEIPKSGAETPPVPLEPLNASLPKSAENIP